MDKKMTETDWAKRNLELAGFMGPDSDYGGMIGEAVCRLLDELQSQGHSGASHYQTLAVFNAVATGKTALTMEFWRERFEDYNKLAVEMGGEPWAEEAFENIVMKKPKPGEQP